MYKVKTALKWTNFDKIATLTMKHKATQRFKNTSASSNILFTSALKFILNLSI